MEIVEAGYALIWGGPSFIHSSSMICAILLAMIVATSIAVAADNNVERKVIVGATVTAKVEGLTYRVALIEDQKAGVIGVELEWTNNSSAEGRVQKKQNQLPMLIAVWNGSQQVPILRGSIDRDRAATTSIVNGMEVRDLPPGKKTVYFVDLKSVIDSKSVTEEIKNGRIMVFPRVHVPGVRPLGIDGPLPGETFKDVRLTPEGLALDARKMHEQLVLSRGK